MSEQSIEMANFGITKDDQIAALMEQSKNKDEINRLLMDESHYRGILENYKPRKVKKISFRNGLALIIKSIRRLKK